MTRKVVAIIQARMGSSRLPGKVLQDIGGGTMLARTVTRTSRARLVDEVLVATTTDVADDVLANYCEGHSIAYSRGSQYDVLDRYYQAARPRRADVVVRITADCPVVDPDLIDAVVSTLEGEAQPERGPVASGNAVRFDFAANRLPPPWTRTYPIGLDTEVCTFDALQHAWEEATEPQQREHVMPYLYEGVVLAPAGPGLSSGMSPRGFKIALLDYVLDLGSYRWTVDAPEDLEFIRRVYEYYNGRDDFSWKEVLELVQAHPELMQINADVRHKTLRDIDGRALSSH